MTGSTRVTSTLGSVIARVRRVWQRFLAWTRLSLTTVCAESTRLGRYDYHNYADDVDETPWGTQGGARCRRCGKWFRL